MWSHKLKVVLKSRETYIENIKIVSMMEGFKIEGSLKIEGSSYTAGATAVNSSVKYRLAKQCTIYTRIAVLP